MAARIDLGKVALGAFLIPWWNRRAFARALAVPLLALAALMLSWYYAKAYVPTWAGWVLYVVYWALFGLFAVTTHRLVLLDPAAVAARSVPRWSKRETRFFLRLVAVGVVFAAVTWATLAVLINAWAAFHESLDPETFELMGFAARVPAIYSFGRFCLVFPATAVDRETGLKWAWRLSQGNGWRLFILVGVLPWIFSYALGLLYREDPTVPETIVLTVVGIALFVVEIAAISLSYRELTRDEA
ncbi:MAG TPA: hypothetical protein VF211_03460 [Burkholderiales bacterium]